MVSDSDYHSDKCEKRFVDNLGNHSLKGITDDRPYVWWLETYILSHQDSLLPHHVAGVEYAKKKLKNGGTI